MNRPSELDLTLYALGLLDASERASIDAALARDATLARELAAVRDALAHAAAPGKGGPAGAPSPDLRARVLGIADPATRLHGFADRVARLFDVSRERALELIAAFDAATGWEDGPIPSTRVYHLDAGPAVEGADSGFVRIDAGARFPRHLHKGEERMFIVSGRVRDDAGREWCEGDTIVSRPGDEHALTVDPREPLLFAIVLYEGIEVVGP